VTLILTTPAAAVALLFWAWALGRSLLEIDLERWPCPLADRLRAGAS
jgi:hypothetical protein